MVSTEFVELEKRLENWRRFYRVTIRFEHTPYYTPPKSGHVLDDLDIQTLPKDIQEAILKNKQADQITRLPVRMQDAVKVEHCWRNLNDQAHKWFLKWQYVDMMTRTDNGTFAFWRRMKNYGVKIRNQDQHDKYEKLALAYFQRCIDNAIQIQSTREIL